MASPSKVTTVAVPAASAPTYVLWDSTKPVDSHALGRGLNRVGWRNQVRAGDAMAVTASGEPPVLQPAAPDGFGFSDELMYRGMFELPQAMLGQPLRGESAGHKGSMIAVSGHGVPGFMFSENLVPIGMSRPMETTAPDWRSSPGRWRYSGTVRWNAPAPKIALFSVCRQLQGRPEQFFWAQAMRSEQPVHMILSYHDTAPAADSSAAINQRLFRNLREGQTFVDAWKNCHTSDRLKVRWAVLCYEACVGDTLTGWMRKGELESSPKPDGTILYFDQDNQKGRVVLQTRQEIDCWLTPRGGDDRLPPWYLCAAGAAVDLHVKLLHPAARLLPGDDLYLVASQVRPNYFGPFAIQGLMTLEGQSALISSGRLAASRVVHSDARGNGDDTYKLALASSGPIAISADGHSVTLAATLGKAQNEHIPLYYFNVALRGPNGRRIGMQGELEDDFQYCMFQLPWQSA